MKPPRIVLDLGGLDQLRPGSGQFRYAVDLVRSLAEREWPARFVVLGASSVPIDDLRPVFDRGDGRWTYHPFPRSRGTASAYRDYARLALALLRIRADLCHCLHTRAPVVAPCPLVVTILDMMHELFPEYAEAVRSRPYRIFRWVVRRRARRAICISRTTASDLSRLWEIPRERLSVVYLGLRAFGASGACAPDNAVLRRLGPGPIICSPLNLEPRKNLSTLLQAYATVLTRFPDARLVLFGKAGWAEDREERYRVLLRRLGLAGRVLETGVVSDADLWWLYRRSSLFAFPSLYEGFGYPVLEAMAAGACPVVRGCSAMAELAADAGVLVEPLTPETLAAALNGLLGDEPGRRALSRAAQKRAGQFTSARMAEETFAAYQTALGRP